MGGDSIRAAVDSATEWADSGVNLALRELALTLAGEIDGAAGSSADKPPPVAQLAKELRATLEQLEDMRDGNDAGADLGVVLSSPVWDGAQSG